MSNHAPEPITHRVVFFIEGEEAPVLERKWALVPRVGDTIVNDTLGLDNLVTKVAWETQLMPAPFGSLVVNVTMAAS